MQLVYTGLDEKEIKALSKKHIYSVEELVRWFPRQYRDYREVRDILDCRPGYFCAVKGKLVKCEVKSGNIGKYVSMRFVSNGRKDINGDPVWFGYTIHVGKYAGWVCRQNSAYLQKDVVVTGRIEFDQKFGYSISYPELFYEKEFVAGIKCIYPKIKGIEEERLKAVISHYVPLQGEMLESEIVGKFGLDRYTDVLEKLHHPQSAADIIRGKKQMVFYDLMRFALGLKELDDILPEESSVLFPKHEKTDEFIRSLPFPLTQKDTEEDIIPSAKNESTGGQLDAVKRMYERIMDGKRLNALVEGDVGCGKTLAAVIMMILAWENGYQSVLMAPKFVLAVQHYEEISGYAEKLGIGVSFIHSGKTSHEKKMRKIELEKIASGEASIIIGTHSCYSEDVKYKSLGLIVYDEEHEFGVDQKIALYNKAVTGVHSIEMSATPIPRSMAMTVYSSKEIERITIKPEGRIPIQTASCTKSETAFKFMEGQLEAGHQCYAVVPAVEDNEEFCLTGIKTVAKKYKEYFEPRGYTVGIVHGKMKEDEFTKEMEGFKNGEIQILVATTVVEVGVNVPNATVIAIHQSDRFGLSQLHQLRGRVGRKDYKSYCILLTDKPDNDRIRVMKETTDGFRIAEEDFKLRGPGDVNGTDQSGQNIYIEEAISYPEMFREAKEAASLCTKENGYGNVLLALYKDKEKR